MVYQTIFSESSNQRKIHYADQKIFRSYDLICDPWTFESLKVLAESNIFIWICVEGGFLYQLLPESKFRLKFFYDNGGSAGKKSENDGISQKKKRRLLQFCRNLSAIAGVRSKISSGYRRSGGKWRRLPQFRSKIQPFADLLMLIL